MQIERVQALAAAVLGKGLQDHPSWSTTSPGNTRLHTVTHRYMSGCSFSVLATLQYNVLPGTNRQTFSRADGFPVVGVHLGDTGSNHLEQTVKLTSVEAKVTPGLLSIQPKLLDEANSPACLWAVRYGWSHTDGRFRGGWFTSSSTINSTLLSAGLMVERCDNQL